MNSIRLCWVGVLILLGLAGCANTPPEIKIGLIVPLSGENGESTGQPAVNAAQMAVNEVNGAGGLLVGKTHYLIDLVVVDDEGVPETAVSAAQQLINQEGVVAIVGPMFSSNAIPVGEVAETAHIPMISPTSTNPQTTLNKQYVFRASFVDDFQGLAMARFAYEDLGSRRSAMLYDVASAYNQGLAAAYQTAFEALGGQIVAAETYTTDQAEDFSEQLARIKVRNPDSLFLPNYTDDVLLQGQQARDMGIDAVILGGDSWEGERLSGLPTFEQSFFSGHYCRDKSNPVIRLFSDQFEKLYGREPNGLMALTYDSVGLLFAAMQDQASTVPEAIRDGLYHIDYQGITGTITFDETGDPVKSVAVWYIANGERSCYQMIEP
ncbi:MAG: ABC transporter substrate-binding protein [Ardenticatenaceae bacterium]|nr:ABC transporter substrate-binding protein [Ardenticatenaceae bacterium]MCB9443180.1 ABC transporter substrate-binding protein [Ardenticatenaceae bacterium]